MTSFVTETICTSKAGPRVFAAVQPKDDRKHVYFVAECEAKSSKVIMPANRRLA